MLKNRDLKQFMEEASILNPLTGRMFVIPLNRNKALIKKEISLFDALKTPDKAFTVYQKAGQEIHKKFAEKDDKGLPKTHPVQVGNRTIPVFTIPTENRVELAKELAALRETHKEALDIQESKEEEYTKAMDEEATVKLFIMSESSLPENISVKQHQILLDVGMTTLK